MSLGTFGFAVYFGAFEGGYFFTVESDTVQVAAAIVEITDTLPVGTDGFGTVAQCIIAVMPDVASGCAVQTVVAVFSDKVAEFVVDSLGIYETLSFIKQVYI